MKKQVLTIVCAAMLMAAAQAQQVVTVSGNISSNTTWSKQNIYLLNGFVYVTNGATLTIEPGALIKGDKASKGTLIVERGAKIMAEGTAQQPIVFTSNRPAGQREVGDWGGIIILGSAPVNLNNPTIEGGVSRPYGGSNAADNSGKLKYVRIEYPGIAFQPNNEINGLTLGGVGSGTEIDYVQVSYSGDDAIEWFGGTVNAKHLVAYAPVDDMFDTDNGFSGKVQYVIGLSDSTLHDVSRSNGFESDNDATGSGATPFTSAVFSNVSLFGPQPTVGAPVHEEFGRGMHLRRNTHLQVHNSLLAGWPTGLLLDGSGAQSSVMMKNTVISGSPGGSMLKAESGSTFNVSGWYTTSGNGNLTEAENSTLGVMSAFSMTSPDFMPAAGSVLHTGGSTSGLDSFFDNVSFRGAMGTDNWTAGWTNFDPQNTAYSSPNVGRGEDLVQATAAVYPNPATGSVYVAIEEQPAQTPVVTVTDVTGKAQAVGFRPVAGKGGYAIELDGSTLAAGLYVVQLSTGSKVYRARLVMTR